MKDNYKCPKCGNNQTCVGYQIMQSKIYTDTKGLRGSNVKHVICLECGYIIESYAVDTKIFKK